MKVVALALALSLFAYAQSQPCDADRKHGKLREADACYEALTRAPDPFIRAQGHFGLQQYEEANDEFREELVTRFLPLARKLARRYSGAHEPFDDLLQVASLGLVKAIDRYDTSRGTAFSSFAVPTILGELKRYFRDLGWSVHVPRGAQELALKVEDGRQQLMTRNGRPPSVPELAEFLELSIEEVLEALETAGAHHTASLDSPREDGDEESGTLADHFGRVDERFDLVDAKVTISEAARHLGARERRVLLLRFVEDLTQSQIAEIIGVSQMQVSRILRRALEQLRELTQADELSTLD